MKFTLEKLLYFYFVYNLAPAINIRRRLQHCAIADNTVKQDCVKLILIDYCRYTGETTYEGVKHWLATGSISGGTITPCPARVT